MRWSSFLVIAFPLLPLACTAQERALGDQCTVESDCPEEMVCAVRVGDAGVGQCTVPCDQDRTCPGYTRLSVRVWCVPDPATDAGFCQRAPPE